MAQTRRGAKAMIRYRFTGHLTPLPPGIKLPLELSGEVYLPSEVETEIARIKGAHAAEVAELHERLRKMVRRSMGHRNRKSKSRITQGKGE